MLKKLSLKMKFMLLCFLCCFALVALIVLFLYNNREISINIEDDMRDVIGSQIELKLKLTTDAVANSLGMLANGLQEKDQIAMINQAVSNFRFEDDKSGYFFVYKDYTPVVLPARPDLVGKSLYDLKDAHGVFYVRELRDTGLNQTKDGRFVYYVFSKPNPDGTTTEVKKVSYAQKIPNTNFWIGTGTYFDIVGSQAKAHSDTLTSLVINKILSLGLIVFVIFVIIMLLLWTFFADIIKGIRIIQDNLISFFDYLSFKTNDISLKSINSKDEFGQMALLINKNVEDIKLNTQTDRQTIAEFQNIVSRFKKGDVSLQITNKPSNPNLNILVNLLNEAMQAWSNLLSEVNQILQKYSNNDFRDKLKFMGGG